MNFNLNNIIHIEDLAKVAANYNLTSSSSKWNSKFDLNGDNIIDIYDIAKVSKAIGTIII